MQAYSQTDTLIGKNVAQIKDYQALTAKVCADAHTEQLKANAIFNWITTHIAFDIDLSKNPNRKEETAKSVLHRGSATVNGFVALYIAMAKEAGLRATGIDGYIRFPYYDNGDPHETISYSWVAVQIDGKWHIVDPTSGTGYIAGYTPWLTRQFRKLSKEKLHYDTKEHFEFHYDPKQFMADPLKFRETKLPADALWQMTKVAMPLSVFEAGAASVDSFNKIHTELANDNSRMLMLANMTDDEKMLETADNKFAFNKRHIAVKGMKLYIEAQRLMDLKPSAASAIEAKSMMKDANGYFKEQKQHFPEHFNALNKKNDAKHREAQEYIRHIETSNKSLSAKCERYERICKTKNSTIHSKYEKLKKPLQVNVRKEKATIIKKAESPEMQKLTDSFEQRSIRATAMQQQIGSLSDSIMIEVQKFSHEYEMIIAHADECNKALLTEAIERIRLNDHYDDEIRPLVPEYNEMRLAKLDTMARKFFDNFDALNKRYEELEKQHDALTDMLALMVKDAATFKAYTNNAPGLSNQYNGITTLYSKSTGEYMNTFARHSELNNNMKTMLKNLKDFAEDEKGLTEKMTIAENARHQKEDKQIAEARNFNEGLNKRHQETAASVINKLDDYLANRR